MDTTRIKAILLAAKYKNLSRAAEDFSYTPSALSHMADALEEELGVKLLSRTRAGVSLTEAGEQLKEKMDAVLLAEEALRAAAAAIGGEKNSELRIAAYSSISTYLLPQIVKRFKKQNPDIRVSIAVVDSLRDMLENDAADVVFGDLTVIENEEHVVIMEDRYVAVLPESILPGCRSVRREALYAYPYISTNEGVLRRYFDETQFAEILRIDSADDTSVLSLAKEGIGVAVISSLAARKHPKGVHIATLIPKISRSLGFAYRKKTPTTERFVAFLKDLKIDAL